MSSADLYCLAMRLTDAGYKNVDALILALCNQAGIAYPPQLDHQ